MTYLSGTVKGSKTVLKGILERSRTGSLDCEVVYDFVNNTYSGVLLNNKFEYEEWVSSELDAQNAQIYFQQLLRLSPQRIAIKQNK